MKRKLFSIILTLALITAVLIPAEAFADTAGDLTITGGILDTDYTYTAGTHTLTIITSTAMEISGTTILDKIIVTSGATANLTLSGLSITSAECALDIGASSNVTLSLTGTNTLSSSGTYAALRVPSSSTLTLSGSGALTATAETGASIGGSFGESGGTINITSGRITTSATDGAGIGGGSGAAGGSITISGGTVNTTSTGGAGIGGGAGGVAGSCAITGGSVQASSIAPAVTGILGVDVYLTTITLENVITPTAMSSIAVTSGTSYAYAISGAYTDASGRLFVYLPDGAITSRAQTGTMYYGSITTTTNSGTSLGTLHPSSVTIDTTTLPAATIGIAYSQAIATTYYGEGTLTFSLSTGTLPTGLSLGTDGIISGTAAAATDAASPYSIEVTVNDGAGQSDTQAYSLVVNGGLNITTASLDPATVGTAYSLTVTHSYAGSLEIRYGATNLPAGLTMSIAGVISGTPTTTTGSPFDVVITATAGTTSETDTVTLPLTVSAAPVITITSTSPLTPGTVGVAYSQQITDSLSGAGVTYSETDFPAWLSISVSGLITGTPTTGADSGSPYTVHITASATGYTPHTKEFTLVINPAAPVLNINTTTLTAATVGTSYTSGAIDCTYTGSYLPVTYVATSLPPGLAMATNGIVSGTPTTAGIYNLSVTASEQAPGTLTDTQTMQLTVNPLTSITITNTSLASGEVGIAYSQTITRTYTGTGTVTFSATGLPSGLSINASTGVISGTPAWDTNLASPFLVTITATDGTVSNQKTLSLTIIKKYVITASAGSGGSITPSGTLNVLRYSNQSFTIKANSGYKISSVTVDGVNKGALSSYTFSNIIDPHTISVKFKSTSISSSNDDDDDDNFSSTYTMRTLNDSASGVTVSGSGVHKLATLKVEDIQLMAEGQSAGSDAIRARLADSRYVVVFQKNLSLSHAFTGTLTISIPVDAQYNGARLTVLHDKKGTAETLTATVTNGKAVFTVTSLSPFVAFVDMQSMATPTPSQTLTPTPLPTATIAPTPLPTATPAPKSSASSLFLWLLGGIIVVALAVTIFVRMRSR